MKTRDLVDSSKTSGLRFLHREAEIAHASSLLAIIWTSVCAASVSVRRRLMSFFDTAMVQTTTRTENRAQELQEPALARIIAYERWFEFAQEGSALDQQFPEEPLDNPSIVTLYMLYLHEPPQERYRLEEEHRAFRRRFLQWRAQVESLRSKRASATVEGLDSLLEEYEKLGVELSAVQKYAADLGAQGSVAPMLPARAVEAVVHAAQLLEEARIHYKRVAYHHPLPKLVKQMRQARKKLRGGKAAIEEKRSVTALRLASEVVSLAGEMKERTLEIGRHWEEIDRRAKELRVVSPGVERAVIHVKEEFQAATEKYASASYLEIRGADAAAERAVLRARELYQSALQKRVSGEPDGDLLEEATHELAQALHMLSQASALAEKIESHLEMLATAAVSAREKTHAAETAVDRGWVLLHQLSASEEEIRWRAELLQRATELASRAREEMGRHQPDGLAIAALADRSADLAGKSQSSSSLESTLATRSSPG